MVLDTNLMYFWTEYFLTVKLHYNVTHYFLLDRVKIYSLEYFDGNFYQPPTVLYKIWQIKFELVKSIPYSYCTNLSPFLPPGFMGAISPCVENLRNFILEWVSTAKILTYTVVFLTPSSLTFQHSFKPPEFCFPFATQHCIPRVTNICTSPSLYI